MRKTKVMPDMKIMNDDHYSQQRINSFDYLARPFHPESGDMDFRGLMELEHGNRDEEDDEAIDDTHFLATGLGQFDGTAESTLNTSVDGRKRPHDFTTSSGAKYPRVRRDTAHLPQPDIDSFHSQQKEPRLSGHSAHSSQKDWYDEVYTTSVVESRKQHCGAKVRQTWNRDISSIRNKTSRPLVISLIESDDEDEAKMEDRCPVQPKEEENKVGWKVSHGIQETSSKTPDGKAALMNAGRIFSISSPISVNPASEVARWFQEPERAISDHLLAKKDPVVSENRALLDRDLLTTDKGKENECHSHTDPSYYDTYLLHHRSADNGIYSAQDAVPNFEIRQPRSRNTSETKATSILPIADEIEKEHKIPEKSSNMDYNANKAPFCGDILSSRAKDGHILYHPIAPLPMPERMRIVEAYLESASTEQEVDSNIYSKLPINLSQHEANHISKFHNATGFSQATEPEGLGERHVDEEFDCDAEALGYENRLDSEKISSPQSCVEIKRTHTAIISPLACVHLKKVPKVAKRDLGDKARPSTTGFNQEFQVCESTEKGYEDNNETHNTIEKGNGQVKLDLGGLLTMGKLTLYQGGKRTTSRPTNAKEPISLSSWIEKTPRSKLSPSTKPTGAQALSSRKTEGKPSMIQQFAKELKREKRLRDLSLAQTHSLSLTDTASAAKTFNVPTTHKAIYTAIDISDAGKPHGTIRNRAKEESHPQHISKFPPTRHHPSTGGKSYNSRVFKQYLEELKHRESDTESLASSTTVDLREESPFNDADYVYWEYQIWRKTWSIHENEDDAYWAVCGDDSYWSTLREANAAAGREVLRRRNGFGLGPQVIAWRYHLDDFGMANYHASSRIGHTKVKVGRFLRNATHGKKPSSKLGWLKRDVYDIMRKTTHRFLSNDMGTRKNDETELFEAPQLEKEEYEATRLEVVDGPFTILDQANRDAAELVLRMGRSNHTARYDEFYAKQLKEKLMQERLDALERMHEPFRETVEDQVAGKVVNVWVEKRELKGPRNI